MQARFNERVQQAFRGTVWTTGCASCYRQSDGRIFPSGRGRRGATGCGRAASTRRATISSGRISGPRNRSAPSAPGAWPRSAPPARGSGFPATGPHDPRGTIAPTCRKPRRSRCCAPATPASRTTRSGITSPDAPAITAEVEKTGCAEEVRDRVLDQVLVAQHQDSRAREIRPARHVVRPRPEHLRHEQRVVRRRDPVVAEPLDGRIGVEPEVMHHAHCDIQWIAHDVDRACGDRRVVQRVPADEARAVVRLDESCSWRSRCDVGVHARAKCADLLKREFRARPAGEPTEQFRPRLVLAELRQVGERQARPRPLRGWRGTPSATCCRTSDTRRARRCYP